MCPAVNAQCDLPALILAQQARQECYSCWVPLCGTLGLPGCHKARRLQGLGHQQKPAAHGEEDRFASSMSQARRRSQHTRLRPRPRPRRAPRPIGQRRKLGWSTLKSFGTERLTSRLSALWVSDRTCILFVVQYPRQWAESGLLFQARMSRRWRARSPSCASNWRRLAAVSLMSLGSALPWPEPGPSPPMPSRARPAASAARQA